MKDTESKARELVLKFSKPFNKSNISFNDAKQYAITIVDEILEVLYQIFESYDERKYWLEVRDEIEKL